MTDESGTTGYPYDAFGNLTQSTRTTRGVAYTTGYTYDDGNHLIAMTYPTGRVITLQRDGVRRLSQIDVVMSGSPKTIISNLQHRADNQLTQRTFGNGLIDQRQYDLQGRLIAETDTAKKEYLWDDTLTPIAQIDTDIGETLSYPHTDHLITPRLATDETQTVVWKWEGGPSGIRRLRSWRGYRLIFGFRGSTSTKRLICITTGIGTTILS